MTWSSKIFLLKANLICLLIKRILFPLQKVWSCQTTTEKFILVILTKLQTILSYSRRLLRISKKNKFDWNNMVYYIYSRVCWVYLAEQKFEADNVIHQFHKLITKFPKRLSEFFEQTIGEDFSIHITQYLFDNCIHHQSSWYYTHQQNGVDERNRHLF